LAGLGSKSNFCRPKKWLLGNHLSYWNLVSGCRQTKVWIKRPCLKLARFQRNLPRTKLGILIGLLTEHVRLNENIHTMGLLSDPTCAAGVGTSSHMRSSSSGKPKNLNLW
jgi:hypothetical protein